MINKIICEFLRRVAEEMKRAKYSILYILLILIFIILGYSMLNEIIFPYLRRNKICQPEELIKILEVKFNLYLSDISNIQTAKSLPYLGDNRDDSTFILNFTAIPDFKEKFIKLLSEEKNDGSLILEGYNKKYDNRSQGFFIPEWFKVPINKGEKLIYQNRNGTITVFIDTSNTEKLTFYIEGYYSSK